MTKHKHSEMIKAKADNMELVVFINNYGQWELGDLNNLVDLDALPAFLCLPKHKEACLHWLNGGDCLISFDSVKDVCAVIWGDKVKEWRIDSGFMNEKATIRIKPKKEKRTIGVNSKTGETTRAYYLDDEGNYAIDEVRLKRDSVLSEWQFIEIEIEV